MILRAILGALLGYLTGWWGKRQAARDAQRATDNQAFADSDTAAIREHAAVATQAARDTTDEAITVARAEPDPVRLRDDVQAAIDRASAGGGV